MSSELFLMVQFPSSVRQTLTLTTPTGGVASVWQMNETPKRGSSWKSFLTWLFVPSMHLSNGSHAINHCNFAPAAVPARGGVRKLTRPDAASAPRPALIEALMENSAANALWVFSRHDPIFLPHLSAPVANWQIMLGYHIASVTARLKHLAEHTHTHTHSWLH